MQPLLRSPRLAAAFLAAFLALPAMAQWNSGAPSPAVEKARAVERLRLAPDTIVPAAHVALAPVDPAAVEAMKQANTRSRVKRMQIGLGRAVAGDPQASSEALRWASVPGGLAAHWEVTSPGARALRVGLRGARVADGIEIRVAGSAAPAMVYGPFTARDFPAGGRAWWSPVLEGETATVEVFAPDAATAASLALGVAQVSHLVASPADPKLESELKAGSQPCEVDLVCRASSDAALANTGKAVARMVFIDAGQAFVCTGTLLNPTDGSFTPYFYTANHCMDTQAVADTLVTYWFYDSLACGTDVLNPNAVQMGGGGRLLYANESSDGALLRLNQRPPAGAYYSGWDASTIGTGTPMVGVHHPNGDLTKVSLASMGGYGTTTLATGSFIIANWNSIATGVTEGGSSGSGIFTSAGSEYRLRGGLLGGPSSCSATPAELHDYYSRLDQVYPSIAQYLNGPPAANYTALWYNPSESGWGINFDQQGDILFASLFTYDENGAPMWLVMSNGARQGSADAFAGTLYRTTGPAFNANPFTAIGPANISTVGTLSVTFSSAASGTLTYTYNGAAVTKAITKQVFGSHAPTCVGTFGDRSSLTNYQDLWWAGASESGWGVNIAHQDNTLFATLFTYDATGKGMWLDMPGGTRQADGTYLGDLYVVTHGSPFNAQPFNPISASDVRKVGTMHLQFQSGTSGTMSYSVDGVNVTKAITRQEFSGPLPACS